MHISVKVRYLKSVKEKLIGLSFTKNIEPVYFRERFGIHTFFMKSQIDVLILDGDNVVRTIKRNLKPWRIFFWHPKYYQVIELPPGSIDKIGIDLGNILKIKFLD